MDNEVNITADIEIDQKNSKIHYVFGPHGTVFNMPIRIEMSWSYLDKYDGNLELWYLQDNGEWLLENPVVQETDNTFIGFYNPDGSLQVWYVTETGECIPLEDAVITEDTIIETTNSRIIVYIDHFSEYYFPRR